MEHFSSSTILLIFKKKSGFFWFLTSKLYIENCLKCPIRITKVRQNELKTKQNNNHIRINFVDEHYCWLLHIKGNGHRTRTTDR